MFGGRDPVARRLLGDTWEFDGSQWTEVSTIGPAPRFQHAMTYDAARGKVILFGGKSGKELLGDTWLWDGATWTQESGPAPTARDHNAIAYDESRQAVVMFGGWDNKTFLSDIWEWTGAWRRIDATGPDARGGLPTMVYDSARRLIVLRRLWHKRSVHRFVGVGRQSVATAVRLVPEGTSGVRHIPMSDSAVHESISLGLLKFRLSPLTLAIRN